MNFSVNDLGADDADKSSDRSDKGYSDEEAVELDLSSVQGVSGDAAAGHDEKKQRDSRAAALEDHLHGSGSSPFPFEMERLQFTVRISSKIIMGQKLDTSFKMLTPHLTQVKLLNWRICLIQLDKKNLFGGKWRNRGRGISVH